jgi:glucokinase
MVIGVEIGGTKLQVVAGDVRRGGAAGGDIIARRWRGTVQPQYGGEGIRQQVADAVRSMLMDEPGVRAIGVGFGGPVDWRTGRICKSHQIRGWDDFPLGQWLSDLTHLPVAVENDANVAALAEATAGAGRGCDPVFYVTLGSGVGGGLVAGGQIYHGTTPGEAEFGHLCLDRAGTTLESRCSGWAVDARIRRLQSEHPGSALARLIGNASGGEARHLAAALAQNDPAARQVMDELSMDLAFGLSHAVHLFHPLVIIIGGGLSLIGQPLCDAISEALPRFVMKAFHPAPLVKIAEQGEDPVPVGALELAAREEKRMSAQMDTDGHR